MTLKIIIVLSLWTDGKINMSGEWMMGMLRVLGNYQLDIEVSLPAFICNFNRVSGKVDIFENHTFHPMTLTFDL